MGDSGIKTAQEELNVEALVELGRRLGGKNGEEVRKRIIHKYTKDMEKDMDELMQDYLSPKVREKLAFYEKIVCLMEAFQDEKIADLAADLGMIYDRRKEPDKSLKYHEKSMVYYEIAGNMTCYLMELMNVSETLDKLGQSAKAINVLRMGLRKAAETKKEVLEVNVAQTLLAILIKADDEQNSGEILKCFDIWEKYVRGAASQSDLANFLFNKLVYLKKEDVDVWKPVLEEFGQIVRENGLKEFEHRLEELERLAKRREEIAAEGNVSSLEEVLELITELLPQDNKFVITKTSQSDEKYFVICEPETESDEESEIWHFCVNKKEPPEMNVVIHYAPLLCAENAVEHIKAYIKWWMNYLMYGVRYDEEQKCINAVLNVKAESREEIIRLFNYQRKLWDVDKANFLMLGMDYSDIDMCKELKKRAMKSE